MAKLSKSDLIQKVCNSELKLSKEAAGKVVDTVIDAIIDSTANGEGAAIYGLGTFSVIETAARTGRNPSTGESINIPAGKRIKFQAAKAFKDAVNKG